MKFRNDPDGRRLPVKLDTTSNGEYAPIPLQPVHREARQVAMEAATANAKRLGLKRLPDGAKPLRGFTTDPRCEPHRGPGDLDYLRCVGPE